MVIHNCQGISMQYASFRRPDGRSTFGRREGSRILDCGATSGRGGRAHATDLRAAIAAGALAELEAEHSFALAEITLLPVIPAPGKILCVGLNYEAHRKETGRAQAGHPAIFVRFSDTLVAHGQSILKPAISSELDYEGELAVIIGKAGRAIPRARALDHVAGYSCFNDASVRDWQRHNIQFTPGKNFPATGAFGPWLTTPDSVGDPQRLRILTRLNGEIVQDESTGAMIWPVAELIEYLSAFTPLAPGDVIATGTPAGVGSRREPPLWMKPGDRIEVDIGPVGCLVNPIAQEPERAAS